MRHTVHVVDPAKVMPLEDSSCRARTPTGCGASLTCDRHLIGPAKPCDVVYLLGSDRLGRDVLQAG